MGHLMRSAFVLGVGGKDEDNVKILVYLLSDGQDMEFQYYGNYDRQPVRRVPDQPWWDEEDTLTDRRINGKIFGTCFPISRLRRNRMRILGYSMSGKLVCVVA
ncbi:hypothetical protein ACJJTC_013215 [Scirpophaga incertulas]